MVIAQYTGMEESIYSMTVTGRSAPVKGVNHIIAPTIATVPVRVRIDRALGIRDYLSALYNQAVGMIPFEHTGIRAIKDLLPNMASTLEINNHLVVQPAPENDHMRGFLGMTLVEGKQRDDTFHSHALTLECQLGANDSNAEGIIYAIFDNLVVSEELVKAILRQFAHITEELSLAAKNSNMPLS